MDYCIDWSLWNFNFFAEIRKLFQQKILFHLESFNMVLMFLILVEDQNIVKNNSFKTCFNYFNAKSVRNINCPTGSTPVEGIMITPLFYTFSSILIHSAVYSFPASSFLLHHREPVDSQELLACPASRDIEWVCLRYNKIVPAGLLLWTVSAG